MLLEYLKEDKEINIDDFMVDPKTNSLICEKILFTLKYTKPQYENGKKSAEPKLGAGLNENKNENAANSIDDNFSLISEKDLNLEQLEMVIQNLDKIDDINKVQDKKSMFSLNGSLSTPTTPKAKSTIDLKSDDFLTNAIGKATLSLAQVAFNPNMIIEDKNQSQSIFMTDDENIEVEQKEHEKNLINYMEQTRFKNKDKEVKSWQIRVNIIELKHILGNNEQVFCTIEYGNQELFKTKAMPIDCLKFNELFSHRIEKIKPDEFYYSVIKISVYYYRRFYKSLLIGVFEIDAGTVYKQAAHEFYHKWGLINSLGDDCVKGFIKCDIIVQGKGGNLNIS